MSILKSKIGFAIGRNYLAALTSGKSTSWTSSTSTHQSHSSVSNSSASLPLTSNFDYQNGSSLLTDFRVRYSTESSTGGQTLGPPKRSLNVFALFVKDRFKTMPVGMPIKEKFVKAGEEWRQLSLEEKDEYKRRMTDGFVRYRKEMANYLDSLSPEELQDYKKQQKEKTKDQTRHRIKLKLRKLNYPKRNCSAYIFFVKAQLKEQYPDGVYPAVRSPEHIRMVGMWSQRWRNMSAQERKPYDELAEADRVRYFEQLEKWKHDLAKPENEEDFQQLERLSKKMESCSRSLSNSPDVARKEEQRKEAKKRKAMAKLAKRANATKSGQLKKKKTTKTTALKKTAKASGNKSVASGKKLAGTRKAKPTEEGGDEDGGAL